MEPIAETRALLQLLAEGADDERFEQWLLTRAEQVASLIEGCAGITIALIGELGLTFTFLATADDLRVVDGAQYLDGGPCEDAVHHDTRIEAELLSEQQWWLTALAGADAGVQSSLSLPIRSRGDVVGSVNFYATSAATFVGRGAELAELFGAAAEEAVSNADLSMTGVERARQSTVRMVDEATVHRATGVLAERERLTVDDARHRLADAAARAGVPVPALARLVVQGAGQANS